MYIRGFQDAEGNLTEAPTVRKNLIVLGHRFQAKKKHRSRAVILTFPTVSLNGSPGKGAVKIVPSRP
jgi:hypothetical protein